GRECGNGVAYEDSQVGVFDSAQTARRFEDTTQLASKAVQHAVAPEQGEQHLRVFLAHRRQAAHERFGGKARALLDTIKCDRLDGAAEIVLGETAYAVPPTHRE